ncbi:MAG: NAD-dependent epimerase/dehydratase family protein, partial [Rhodoluna sp.]
MNSLPRVVIAGGSGSLGQKVAANFSTLGHEVFILTRKVRDSLPFKQIAWDGENVDDTWASLIPGSILVNLAGELVDRRPTQRNIALLKSSRELPTKALVDAASEFGSPSIWLQMSTLAIYGDAGEVLLSENSTPAAGPEQMAGVATLWEAALPLVAKCRTVFLRTGIVLDR